MTMRSLLVLFSIFLGIYGVGFEVAAGGTECFWEEAKSQSAITVVFQVTHGGYLDIDIEVVQQILPILFSDFLGIWS